MDWYLVHSKPKQEMQALEHLIRQGYECYLPMYYSKKIRRGSIKLIEEPLFPRYLFLQLDSSSSGKSWSPIRSTRGVSRLVTFGDKPAKIAAQVIDHLRVQSLMLQKQPQQLFNSGEPVRILSGAFAGIEAVFQMNQGEDRAMVLIEILSQQVTMAISPIHLSKVG